VVVSHDRWFVERVCDNVYALTGDGGIRHLPRGIDQYLEERRAEPEASAAPAQAPKAPAAGGVARAARKEVVRIERALEKLADREATLHEDMALAATDHARLRGLNDDLAALAAERERLESEWLETAASLE
jgi:ATP-binding cassette subfamily F protein uup